MKTREEIIQILTTVKPELEERFKVKRMALFGSYARGEQEEKSDVDILVDVDPSIGLEFVSLAETIEQMLGLRIDLVSRRAVSPRHFEYIEPELIYV